MPAWTRGLEAWISTVKAFPLLCTVSSEVCLLPSGLSCATQSHLPCLALSKVYQLLSNLLCAPKSHVLCAMYPKYCRLLNGLLSDRQSHLLRASGQRQVHMHGSCDHHFQCCLQLHCQWLPSLWLPGTLTSRGSVHQWCYG